MATNGINIVLNGTRKNQQKTIKVLDSLEFMEVLNGLSDILFDSSDKMEEGVYLELYNKLEVLYSLDLTIDIIDKSGGKIVNKSKGAISFEKKRKALQNGDTSFVLCPKCNTCLKKISLPQHLLSNKCVDTHHTADAMECQLTDAENSAILEKYDEAKVANHSS